MITVEIDDRELDKVIRSYSKYNKSVHSGVQKEVRRSALNIQGGARMRVPVASNHLRSSIQSRFVALGLGATIGTPLKYGQFVERGRGPGGFPPLDAIISWVRIKITRNPKAAKTIAFLIARKIARFGTKEQPFLHPAFNKERPRFVNNIIRVLKKS